MGGDEDRTTRGFWLTLGGIALIPATLLFVAIVPERARMTVFLLGLAAVASVAARGGWIAKQAFVDAAPHRGRAFAAAVLGLGLAATTGLILLWSVVAVALG